MLNTFYLKLCTPGYIIGELADSKLTASHSGASRPHRAIRHVQPEHSSGTGDRRQHHSCRSISTSVQRTQQAHAPGHTATSRARALPCLPTKLPAGLRSALLTLIQRHNDCAKDDYAMSHQIHTQNLFQIILLNLHTIPIGGTIGIFYFFTYYQWRPPALGARLPCKKTISC